MDLSDTAAMTTTRHARLHQFRRPNDHGAARAAVPARTVLSCVGLRYGPGEHPLIDALSFTVFSGEAYGLIGGVHGAVKTTLVRLVCGLLPPDRGRVLVEGRPIHGDLTRPVGYVPQNSAAFPSLTVAETVRLWARLAAVPPEERRERTQDALVAAGLESHRDVRVDRCSEGVLRELSLAVALLHRPRLLVLDEPTQGIDPQSRTRLLATLGRLRDKGTSLLYLGRDLDEVERLCDRVGVLRYGRLIAEGRLGSLPVSVA